MSRQVNVTLDDDTLAIIDSLSATDRDRFIGTAIRQHGIYEPGPDLRRRLQEGAIARAERDRDLAEEWTSLEDEVCQTPEA